MDSLTGPIESVAFLRTPPEIIVAIVSEVLAIGDNFEAQLRGYVLLNSSKHSYADTLLAKILSDSKS